MSRAALTNQHPIKELETPSMTHHTDFGRAFALNRPLRVLDGCCCIGGATEGYRRAFPGCHITGVDKEPQPDYCGDVFHQGDIIEFIHAHGHELDFIHVFPSCQGDGAHKARNAAIGRTYPRLIAPVRAALEATGQPYVMENEPGSEVRKDIRLCGEQFGLAVLMHRYFELGRWTALQPSHPKHRGRARGWRHGEYHDGPYVAAYGKGGGKASVEEIRVAKGIDWSSDHLRLREAPVLPLRAGKVPFGNCRRCADNACGGRPNMKNAGPCTRPGRQSSAARTAADAVPTRHAVRRRPQEPPSARGPDARAVHRAVALAPAAAAGSVRAHRRRVVREGLRLRHAEWPAGGAAQRLPVVHAGGRRCWAAGGSGCTMPGTAAPRC